MNENNNANGGTYIHQFENKEQIFKAFIDKFDLSIKEITNVDEASDLLQIFDDSIGVNSERSFIYLIDNQEFEQTYLIDLLFDALTPDLAKQIDVYVCNDREVKFMAYANSDDRVLFEENQEAYENKHMLPRIFCYCKTDDTLFMQSEVLTPIGNSDMVNILTEFENRINGTATIE